MIVTEEEAKTKECRPCSKGNLIAKCSGSKCMGWVWADNAKQQGTCGYITNVMVNANFVQPREHHAGPNSRLVIPKV